MLLTNPLQSAHPRLENCRKAGQVTRTLLWWTGAVLCANQVMMHVIPDERCCAEGGERPSAHREAGPLLMNANQS